MNNTEVEIENVPEPAVVSMNAVASAPTTTLAQEDLDILNRVDMEFKVLAEQLNSQRSELRKTELAVRGSEVERTEVHAALVKKYGLTENHSIDRGTGVISLIKR